MLELLISILMAFGITYNSGGGKIKVSQDVVTKAQAKSNYNELGGDAALYEYIETGSTLDDVVIGLPVDPKSTN